MPEQSNLSNLVILNEWSQGTNGGKEWVEFLVVGDGVNPTVNLQNAVLADTNRGMARLQLSGDGFANLPVGTYLVIYNAGDPDDTLAPKTTFDPANGDFTLIIPSINPTGDYAITSTRSTANSNFWASGTDGGALGNNAPGDVPVLMSEASGFFNATNAPSNYTPADAIATFYGILPFNDVTQGTPPAPSVGGIGANGTFLYLGQDATGITTDSNWSRDTNNANASGNSRTPGEANAQVIINQTGNGTRVAEGGATDDYTIVLRSQPTDNVIITVTPDDQTNLGSGQGTAITLTFTPTDWYTPQTVTVSAFDDPDVEAPVHASVITHTVTSNNANSLYNSTNNVPFKIDGAFVASSNLDIEVEDNEENLPDLDGDGIADNDNDGILDAIEDANTDGDNDPTTNPTDTDSDGIADYQDLDADNDGIPDVIEAQTTEGYIAPTGIDENEDGVDDAYGTGLTPVDTDGDGVADYLDTDSDEDGIEDSTESGLPPLVGTDADGDGLDDGVDSNPAGFGAADAGLTPASLSDTDGDVATGGEVDFRDPAGNAPVVTVDSLTTNDGTPQLTGTVDNPNATVEVTVNGIIYTATNNGDGTWTLADNTIDPALANGTYEVTATATDEVGTVGTDTTTDELVIAIGNFPSFTSTPVTTGTEDSLYSYTITTTDPDSEEILTLTAKTLPNWLNFTDNGDGTATLTGTPTNDEVGEYDIELEVEDADGNLATQTFTITVAEVNDDPPVVVPIPDQNIPEDSSLVLDISDNFTELDLGDTLTYTATDLPDGLSIDPNTGIISGTPSRDAVGSNLVTIEVSDGDGRSVSETFELVIEETALVAEPPALNVNTNNIFTLTGNVEDVGIKFSLNDRQADNVNEIGVFVVEDEQGTVNGVAPGSVGYLETVLNQGTVIFSVLSDSMGFANPTRILEGFMDSDRLGFYLVQNSTADAVLDNLAAGETPADVFFATSNANTEGFNHLQVSDLGDNTFVLNWEDEGNEGNIDFNDLIVTVELTNDSPPSWTKLQGQQEGELIDLTDLTGQVEAELMVNSEAAYDNFVGLYHIDHENGQIGDLMPGQAGYVAAALERSVLEFDRNGVTSVVELEAGTLLAPYIIANGNSDDILSENGDNQERGEEPTAYFAYLEANPDETDHVRLLGDNTFGFEDTFGGGDGDFNDIVFEINITVG